MSTLSEIAKPSNANNGNNRNNPYSLYIKLNEIQEVEGVTYAVGEKLQGSNKGDIIAVKLEDIESNPNSKYTRPEINELESGVGHTLAFEQSLNKGKITIGDQELPVVESRWAHKFEPSFNKRGNEATFEFKEDSVLVISKNGVPDNQLPNAFIAKKDATSQVTEGMSESVVESAQVAVNKALENETHALIMVTDGVAAVTRVISKSKMVAEGEFADKTAEEINKEIADSTLYRGLDNAGGGVKLADLAKTNDATMSLMVTPMHKVMLSSFAKDFKAIKGGVSSPNLGVLTSLEIDRVSGEATNMARIEQTVLKISGLGAKHDKLRTMPDKAIVARLTGVIAAPAQTQAATENAAPAPETPAPETPAPEAAAPDEEDPFSFDEDEEDKGLR